MSSNRDTGGTSPKEMQGLLASQNRDSLAFPEEMKTNLQKLKALSKDDLTENAMLRSRIDQQSELICILKQRADELLRKTMALESERSELKKSRQDTLELLQNESRKFSVLEKRFTVLNSNHEEMIVLKDEYKTQNKKLSKENDLLQKENKELFARAVQERDEQITKLRQQLECLNERCAASDKNQRLSRERAAALEEKATDDKRNLERHVTRLQEQLKAQRVEYDEVKQKLSESQARSCHAQKEKEEFAGLAVKRGQTIQEQRQEIEILTRKVEQAQDGIREMEDQFSREVENMSASAQVRRMKKQLEKVEERYQANLKEYEAYKRHMETLLAREKELNNRMRVLIG